jgi:hypothetical protein
MNILKWRSKYCEMNVATFCNLYFQGMNMKAFPANKSTKPEPLVFYFKQDPILRNLCVILKYCQFLLFSQSKKGKVLTVKETKKNRYILKPT